MARRSNWAAWTRRIDPGLVAILIIAAAVRLTGIRFGLPHLQCRPDETTISSIATAFYNGQLNPHFFNYPALFMLVVAACLVSWLRLGWLLGYLKDHDAMNALVTTTAVHQLARWLSAAAGVGTVWVVYRIALRLFDRTTALISAGFLALAFLHVRDSHFGVTDVPATFLAMLAFAWVLRLAASGRTRDLVGAAVVAGLAVSTKYNVALIAAPALFVILDDGTRSPGARAGRAAAFSLLMAGAFVAVSPYSIIAWPEFIAALRFESAHLAGRHGRIVGIGWNVHLTTTLCYGLGLPMLAAGIAGLAWLVRTRWRVGATFAMFPVLYFALMGGGYTVFARYMIPVVPFLCIAAAYAVTEAARWLTARTGRPQFASSVAAVTAAIVVAPSAASVMAFDRLLARTDNRLVAASWIEQTYPDGATIAEYGPEGGHVLVAAGDPERQVLYTVRDFNGAGPPPDIIVVQSSPLTGEADLNGAAPIIAREYRLAADLKVDAADRRNVYDVQDEFYLPLAGFAGIARPGPNLKIFVRRPPL